MGAFRDVDRNMLFHTFDDDEGITQLGDDSTGVEEPGDLAYIYITSTRSRVHCLNGLQTFQMYLHTLLRPADWSPTEMSILATMISLCGIPVGKHLPKTLS